MIFFLNAILLLKNNKYSNETFDCFATKVVEIELRTIFKNIFSFYP